MTFNDTKVANLSLNDIVQVWIFDERMRASGGEGGRENERDFWGYLASNVKVVPLAEIG